MMRSTGVRRSLLSALSVLAFTTSFAVVDTAQARHRRHHVRHARHAVAPAHSPAYAAIVVDTNSGKVLHAVNENELRHPASITKVMTLYLLFEQLERGKVSLDSEIPITAHAASMAPSKLGLRPGSTISVENAIKAIVTKSANDIAVAVGESIGGTEDHFAEIMTAKAHALGMSRTNYANASGLPDDDQITTAHDLVILGRSIQERFPRYYAYFSTHQFKFAGRVIHSHNHLMDRLEGMDGIKTGYTRASGFNLLSSVKRGSHRIVAVVLGGRSAGSRDNIMANLVEDYIGSTSPVRTASAIVDTPVEFARVEPKVEAKPEPIKEPAREIASVVKIEAPKPIIAAAYAPPAPIPTATPVADRPRPAVVASAPRSDDRTASIPDRKAALEGSTRAVAASASTGSPTSGMRWVQGPNGGAGHAMNAPAKTPHEVKVAKVEPREIHAAKAEPARPAAARTGVMIQIGATDEAGKATELLSRARTHNAALAGATPFTEKVQKGSETLYRARFAGLSETQADNACKTLKRSGFSCFTTKN
jgi:D-alanyl-D-alanine carboxypeptidase